METVPNKESMRAVQYCITQLLIQLLSLWLYGCVLSSNLECVHVYVYCVCSKQFRREWNKTHHKCSHERRRLMKEQWGVWCVWKMVQKQRGFSVHEYAVVDGVQQVRNGQHERSDGNIGVKCSKCDGRFCWPGDTKRHKCVAERFKLVEEQHDTVKCNACQNGFEVKEGLLCINIAVLARAHNWNGQWRDCLV